MLPIRLNPAAQKCEESSWPTTRLTTPAYLRPNVPTEQFGQLVSHVHVASSDIGASN